MVMATHMLANTCLDPRPSSKRKRTAISITTTNLLLVKLTATFTSGHVPETRRKIAERALGLWKALRSTNCKFHLRTVWHGTSEWDLKCPVRSQESSTHNASTDIRNIATTTE